jgi:hypothetical protein
MAKPAPITPQREAAGPVWGMANPRRGIHHIDPALAFVRDFPIGTVLSPDAFDRWAHQRGLLNVPIGAPKQADVWKAHLQRRHELKYRINRASTHPRMTEFGVSPFTIEKAGRDAWEVRAPHVAISQSRFTEQIVSLLVTKKRKLGYLMQSADWSVLPPHERAFAEALYDDIDGFGQMMDMQAGILHAKFAKLEAKIRRGLESGEMQPKNHGFQTILALERPAEDQGEEDEPAED